MTEAQRFFAADTDVLIYIGGRWRVQAHHVGMRNPAGAAADQASSM